VVRSALGSELAETSNNARPEAVSKQAWTTRGVVQACLLTRPGLVYGTSTIRNWYRDVKYPLSPEESSIQRGSYNSYSIRDWLFKAHTAGITGITNTPRGSELLIV
jgi:hypothetical protein